MSSPSDVLMNWASPVFLFVATLRRKARRGAALTGQQIRSEAIQIFRELDQKARVESAVAAQWECAKKILVYLVDEVALNTEWEYRNWWADNHLEAAILNHSQKMRGILFYDELEDARSKTDAAEKSQSPELFRWLDLLTVFYCCLRFGFEGKLAGQPREIESQTQNILSRLPLAAQSQARQLFQEAYKHTVEIPPTYETYMRVAAVGAVVVGLIALLVGFREILSHQLLDDLKTAAQSAGEFFNTPG